MILVLFFIIISLILILIFLILFSSIKITIQNLKLTNLEKNNKNYNIILSLIIFNKIRWLKVKFDNKKVKKIFKKMHLERVNIKEIERNIKLSDIKELINIKPKLESMDLKVKIGLTDVILTSYAVPVVCSVLAIVLPHITEQKNINNIFYEVKPVYNQNAYSIKLNTTINIKIINLLNSVYKIYRSKRKNVQDKNMLYNV